jgi:flagellar biosynthetic protein FliQ
MSEAFVIHLAREMFYTTIIVAAPLLGVSLVVGILISIFQAATSMNEMTLTFVPKLVTIFIVAVLVMPWMLETLRTFTINIFQLIPQMR